MFPLCFIFFTIKNCRHFAICYADGITSTVATLLIIVSLTITLIPFHASVAALISSPTFFGDKPKGPTLGAKLAAAPISPPTVLRITKFNYYLF